MPLLPDRAAKLPSIANAPRLMHRALIVLTLSACLSTPPAPRADTAVLRVLVWNIHAGADAGGADNLARVAERIRAERADLVLLQEVDRGVARSRGVDQPATLARLTGLHAAFGKSLDYQGGEYGVAILSRWPVVAQATLPLPVDPPQPRSGGATTPRAALVARIAAPADVGPLVVMTSHIDASRDDRWRRQEAARLAAIADSLVARRDGLVLVGGDMNSEPASAPQLALTAGVLRDAWTACGGAADDPASRTYPARAPVKRIDYLYLTPGLACRAVRVPADTASDHRAVVVEVVRNGG